MGEEEEEVGWGAAEEPGAACRSQVLRHMCSEITLGKGAGSGAHFSGSKSSVQLPDPRPMSCSVQFQERAGRTSVHVTNDIFTAGREVNSRNSKSSISIMMQRHCFNCFNIKYPFYYVFSELNRGAPVFSHVSRLRFGRVGVRPGQGGQHLQSSSRAAAQPYSSGPYRNSALLKLCFA